MVDFYLKCRLDEGKITNYDWASDLNAIAPHDFRIQRDGSWEKLEIKTTTRNFGREYHLPHSELHDMVYGGEIYRIGRVYELTLDGAKMRISEDLREFGQTILEDFSKLPPGVAVDGVSITPDEAMFGGEIVLSVPDQDED